MNDFGWDGLIAVFGGIYGLLMAHRILPRNPKDPEKLELWHEKFGGMMKILSPLVIAFGLAIFFSII